MARFYSLKKKDEDNDKIADPFNILRPKVKEKEKTTIKKHDMAKVYEFLATGFEDIEELGQVDVLRRGELDVKTVSLRGDLMVSSAHGVQVKADMLFEDVNFDDADLLLIPGGMPGAKNIDEHDGVRRALVAHAANEKLIGAICAGPMV